MSGTKGVALIVAPGEAPDAFTAAVAHGGGRAIDCDTESGLPPAAGALLVAGTGRFAEFHGIPVALAQAIATRTPILGIGWGMQALNVAMGGRPPIAVAGHGNPDEEPVRHPVFLSPGGKTSYTIAGSGWVTVPSAHTHGLMPEHVADGLLSSVYAEDGVVEAIEKPGHEWLIGVQWPAHLPDRTPRGFDSLLLALVERSQQ